MAPIAPNLVNLRAHARPIATADSIVVVGDVPTWVMQGHQCGVTVRCAFVEFSDLNAATLAKWTPKLVFSPLIGLKFDALDVAVILSRTGFSGAYRAVGHHIPCIDIIRSEVHASADGLDFDVVQTPVDLKQLDL